MQADQTHEGVGLHRGVRLAGLLRLPETRFGLGDGVIPAAGDECGQRVECRVARQGPANPELLADLLTRL